MFLRVLQGEQLDFLDARGGCLGGMFGGVFESVYMHLCCSTKLPFSGLTECA